MSPLAVLPADIGANCTDEELCVFLQKLSSGSPLPRNVINDINPYQYMPSYLPPGSFWYLIRANESKDTNLGYWRPTEKACKIFTDSNITGWRNTLEFHQGRAPHEHKTNWIMQEYRITYQKVSGTSKIKEANLICRVLSVGAELESNRQNRKKMVTSDIFNPFSQPIVPLVEKPSTSKPQVIKDTKTGTLTVTERLPNHQVEIMPEIEKSYPFGDDYIELLDLDRPASFSSSSNSSCLSMSSDECFDSLALLEELESKTSQNQAHKTAGCRYSISVSQKPDKLVMYAAASSSGSLNKFPNKEEVKSRSVMIATSAGCIKSKEMTTEKLSSNLKPDQRTELRVKIATSAVCIKSKEMTTEKLSSNLKPDQRTEDISTSQMTKPPERKKATAVKTKKLKKKYICFMPC